MKHWTERKPNTWFITTLRNRIEGQSPEETLRDIKEAKSEGMKKLMGSILLGLGYGDSPNIWQGSEPQTGGVHK